MKCRKPRDEAKELAEREALSRQWRYWHEENLREALGGPDGFTVKAVMDLLIDLKTTPAKVLVDRIRQIDWRPVSHASRLVLLHEINNAITDFRVAQGLDPISDPLPGQDDNAFRLMKAALFT